jgi:hypothetical protein
MGHDDQRTYALRAHPGAEHLRPHPEAAHLHPALVVLRRAREADEVEAGLLDRLPVGHRLRQQEILGVAPGGAHVVVATDVAQWSVERIGDEAEVLRLQVASADDQVDVADGLAGRGGIQRGVRLIRDGEHPDRSPVPPDEGPRVRPAHAQPIGHGRDS